MGTTFESIEQAAKQLSVRERATLAQILLKGLDEGEDENVEALWAEEAKHRYDAYLSGEMGASPSGEVFARVRERIRG